MRFFEFVTRLGIQNYVDFNIIKLHRTKTCVQYLYAVVCFRVKTPYIQRTARTNLATEFVWRQKDFRYNFIHTENRAGYSQRALKGQPKNKRTKNK